MSRCTHGTSIKKVNLPNPVRELSSRLSRRLNLYTLAAGAAGVSVLALAQPSEAEVVLTGVDVNLGHNGYYAVDLNHDGITDFAIQNTFVGNVSGYFRNRMEVVAGAEAQVLTSNSAGDAAALHSGNEIGPGSGWLAKTAVIESSYLLGTGVYNFGNWLHKKDRFVGLRFEIDGEIHYGWARLSVKNNSAGIMQVHISGFAYETAANQPIRAGQTQDSDSVPGNAELTASSTSLGQLALGARSFD